MYILIYGYSKVFWEASGYIWSTCFLLLGVFVNIYQLYRLDRIEKEVSTKEFNLNTLRQQNEDSRNQKDYLNSDIFKEKFAKEEGFKKRGEEVIDTTLIESQDSESSSYIPVEVESQKTKPILWWEFLFSNE
ncbi:hypothetical protein HC766_01320 [Candidatus Gracilibacteria bacterium]|nr:hypothetical protein [Candidatus Gracilibacteria bacterium]